MSQEPYNEVLIHLKADDTFWTELQMIQDDIQPESPFAFSPNQPFLRVAPMPVTDPDAQHLYVHVGLTWINGVLKQNVCHLKIAKGGEWDLSLLGPKGHPNTLTFNGGLAFFSLLHVYTI